MELAPSLAGKPQDNMRRKFDSNGVETAGGFLDATEIVTSVDQAQCLVVRALDSELDPQFDFTRESPEEGDCPVGKRVGAGGDYQAVEPGGCKYAPVEFLELFRGGVGPGVRLQVCGESAGFPVISPYESDPGGYLFLERHAWMEVRRPGPVLIAEETPAFERRPARTAKPRIYRDPIHPATELILKIFMEETHIQFSYGFAGAWSGTWFFTTGMCISNRLRNQSLNGESQNIA